MVPAVFQSHWQQSFRAGLQGETYRISGAAANGFGVVYCCLPISNPFGYLGRDMSIRGRRPGSQWGFCSWSLEGICVEERIGGLRSLSRTSYLLTGLLNSFDAASICKFGKACQAYWLWIGRMEISRKGSQPLFFSRQLAREGNRGHFFA